MVACRFMLDWKLFEIVWSYEPRPTDLGMRLTVYLLTYSGIRFISSHRIQWIKDRAYGKQFPISSTSQKQSPVSLGQSCLSSSRNLCSWLMRIKDHLQSPGELPWGLPFVITGIGLALGSVYDQGLLTRMESVLDFHLLVARLSCWTMGDSESVRLKETGDWFWNFCDIGNCFP